MSEFLDFVNKYKKAAYSLDLENKFSNVNRILQKWKYKFNSAENEEELKEIQKFTREAYISTKDDILLWLNYTELENRKLAAIRIYFEYKALYDKVTDTLKPQGIKNIKDSISEKKLSHIKKYELFLRAAGYNNTEGLRQYLENCDFPNITLALLIHGIQEAGNNKIHYNRKGFMDWINKSNQYNGVSGHLKKDGDNQNKFEYPNGYSKEELQYLLDKIEEFKNF